MTSPFVSQLFNKIKVNSEVVFYHSFTSTNNEAKISKTVIMQFLKDNLKQRFNTETIILVLCKKRHHFLRLLFGHSEKTCPYASRSDYDLSNHYRTLTLNLS